MKIRPTLETLEERVVPTTWLVNSNADTLTGTGSPTYAGTLRYDITNAVSGDTITFTNSLSGQTISLTSALPTIKNNISIVGLGAGSTVISGGNATETITSVSGGSTTENQSATITVNVTAGTNVFTNGETVNILGISKASGEGSKYVGFLGVFQIINATTSSFQYVITPSSGHYVGEVGSYSNPTAQGGCQIFNIASGVTANISDLTIENGDAILGGGVYNAGRLNLSNSNVSYNNAGVFSSNGGGGGGIFNAASGTLSLSNSTVSYNNAETVFGSGAGIANYGVLMVSYSTISNNNDVLGLGGGGIWNNSGPVTILNSTISNNAGYGGGGIVNAYGSMTLVDDTITENTATESGGGIYSDYGVLTISNSTIFANTVNTGYGYSNGGGLYLLSGSGTDAVQTTTLLNTIVTENVNNAHASESGLGPNIYTNGTSPYNILDATDSLFGDNQSGWSITGGDTSGDIFNATAGVVSPLGNNGGPTQTLALPNGSPAIAAGGALTTVAAVSGTNTIVVAAYPSTGTALGDVFGSTPTDTLIQIGSEQMLVTNVSGNTLTVVRGYNGTTPLSSTALVGLPVYLLVDQRGQVIDTTSPDIGAYQTTATTATPTPTVTSISPTYGSLGGGTSVTITGTNLSNATAVNFGVIQGTIVSDSGTVIVATTPAEDAGTVDITVTTVGWLTSAISQPGDQFTFVPAVTPSTATLLTNAGSFVINGFGFDTSAANYTVSFNDGVSGIVASGTSTTLTVSLTGLANVAASPLYASVSVDGSPLLGGPVQVATVTQVGGDWVVTSAADTNTPGTLRYALANANSKDTIVFASGLGTITLTSPLPTITQNLTITGLGPANTILSGNGLYQVLNIAATATVTISGLTVANGYASNSPGDGIYSAGNLTLLNDVVSGNSNTSSSSTVYYGGGIFNAYSGTLTLDTCTLNGNTIYGYGGAVCNEGVMTIAGSSIYNNSASFGGGVANFGGTLTIASSVLYSNSFATSGGAVYIRNIKSEAVTTLANDTLYGNSLTGSNGSGGGVGVNFGTVVLSNVTIFGNSAAAAGGMEVASGAYVVVQNSIIAGNSAAVGTNLDGEGNNYSATLNVANNNVFGDALGYTVSSGTNNIISSSPGLAATLGSNGGPTMTLALQAGSTAIGQGGAITTVSSDPGGSTIVVANAAALAATPGDYLIQIGSEQMLVTGVTMVTNTLTVIRGYNGTTAVAHSAGSAVYFDTDQRGYAITTTTPDIGAYQSTGTAPGTPTITSVSPASGTSGSGTLVTISGTNLANAIGVTFGNVPGTIVSDSNTTVVAVTPIRYVGVVDTIVTMAGSLSTAATTADRYTFIPGVTVNTATLSATASTVTINGIGFDPTAANNTIVFNDSAVGTVTSATVTTLLVAFTSAPVQAGSLTAVVTTDSYSSGSAVQIATVAPGITATPGSTLLAATANQTITIAGFGFDPTKTHDTVTFNDGAVGSVTSATATSLSVKLTTNPATAGPLTATVTADSLTSGAPVVVATVYPSGISGQSITPAATTQTITGAGFDPNPLNDSITYSSATGVVGTVTSATTTTLIVTFTTQPTVAGSLSAYLTVDGVSIVNGPTSVGAVTPTVTASTGNINVGASTMTIAGSSFCTTTSEDTVSFTDGVAGSVTSATATSLVVTFSPKPTYPGSLLATVTVNGAASARYQVGNIITGTSFTPGNLLVLDLPSGTSISTTASVLELKPATSGQASTVQTIPINGSSSQTTGSSPFRFVAESGDLLEDTNDGTEVVFTGYDTNSSSTLTGSTIARAVGTLTANTTLTQATTYSGTTGKVTEDAASVNDSTFDIADTGGLYTNGGTTNINSSSIVSVKSFGGTVYVAALSGSDVDMYTLNTSTNALTAMSGVSTTDTLLKDFYLVSSGANGSTFDELYTLDDTSATSGQINKYSLNVATGTWTSDGSYATSNGGEALAAAAIGANSGTYLYYTTGSAASGTTANLLVRVTDSGLYNATISAGSPITLYTALSGNALRGIAFAPVSTTPTVTMNTAPLSLSTNSITITGTNFSTNTALDTVTFNLGAVGTVASASATSLTVNYTTEPTSPGSLTAIVSASGVNSGAAVQVAMVGVLVTPNMAYLLNSADTITIAGIGFDPNMANDTVSFGLGAMGSVTSATATSLVVAFSTDPTTSGSLNAVVSVTGNGSSANTQVATVTIPAPTMTSSSANLPNNASTITIAGTNFSSTASSDTVTFSSGAGTVTAATTSTLTVAFTTDPTVIGALDAVVTVTGVGASVGIQVATVTAPTVTSNTASQANNTATITITGSGFSTTTGNDTVVFTDGAVGSVTAAATTSLTVAFSTFPTAPGEMDAVVTVSGVGVSSSSQVATINSPPSVDYSNSNMSILSPTVTIDGFFGFGPSVGDTVTFNLGAVATLTSVGPYSVVATFTTAPTAAGALDAAVSIVGFGLSSSTQVATAVPVITSSTAGLQQYDTAMTIAGIGFDTNTANDSVSFTNGGVTGSVTGASSTSLTVSLTGLSSVANSAALSASVTVDGVGSGTAQQVATVESSFGVNSVTPTPGGLVLLFNAPIDPTTTVLYSSPGDTTYGSADITLVGASVGNVRGSLVIDPTNPDEATFVETSGLLQPDTYTLTVTSAVKAVGGYTLSGNYTTSLTVATTTTPVVSIPSFARGPGQSVTLSNSVGIPISFTSATGVTQASFTLTYDPTLLTIAATGALTPSADATTAGLAISSYTIVNVDAHHSILTVNMSGGTGLTGPDQLVMITASVPTTAPYQDKAVLNMGNVVVNSVSGSSVSGVEAVAYLGDVLGTGIPDATDASLVDQVGTGAGTGFSAFKDLDPAIIAGIDGGFLVNATDASLINEAASGASIGQIPAMPSLPGGTSLTFAGSDPYLYLSAVHGAPGQTVTETLYLDVTDPNGIQLTALDEAIGFDAGVLQISNVRSAAGLAGLGSYATANTVDNTTGVLLVGQAFMGTGLPPVVPYGTDVAVLQFDVTLTSDVAVGTETALTLLQDGSINGQTKFSAISDNEGALTWTPGMTPSNAGNLAIDGSMTVVPTSASEVSEVVVPATPRPVVVLPKVVEPVRKVMPATAVIQPTATMMVPLVSIEIPLEAETVVADVSPPLQASVVLVQLETTVVSNPVTVTPEVAPVVPSPARSVDSGASLSLAALGTNKGITVAPPGTLSTRTSTSVLDEMYRQLIFLGASPLNGVNPGPGGDDGTEDFPEVWAWDGILVELDRRKNTDE